MAKQKSSGWLDKYQEGGLTDKYLGVKTNTTGSYAPINNNWAVSPKAAAYNKAAKQAPTNIDDNAMQALEQVTSYPQRKITELVTGKNQYPSQAMGIQNPYGAFAVDAVLDPTNLVGAGLLGKSAKASKLSKVAKSISGGGSDLASVINTATDKFLDTFVDPIKYKKQIQEVKAAHADLPNYMNSPDVVRRLQNLGINDPSKLKYPDLTFSRGGSHFDNLGNKINIDLSEPARYADSRQFTHHGTFDHEVGHWLQKESYLKGGGYQKDLTDFKNEFKKWKSDKEAWKQKHPSPYTIDAIAEEPDLPSIFPPLPIAKPTVVDDELIKRLSPTITSDVSKQNYNYFKNDGLEAYPFMRETKREMIQQGYIPNETAQVDPSVVASFLKANPKNRISSFVDPNFLNGLHLSKLMNKFPALAPVVGAGAVATATQEYNDGGPIQPNYNNASVSMSKDFVGDGYNTKGRNYSPAWGGQFAMGGSMPGAVGFTYARTGDIPSNGPYAKKTKASAENGKEIKKNKEDKTYYSGMLPEITVVGSKDPQTEQFYRTILDRLTKEEGYANGISSDDPVYNNPKSVDMVYNYPNATDNILGRYEGLMDLGKKYGFPKVNPVDKNSLLSKMATTVGGDSRPPANYDASSKTIQADSTKDWVSEMAHHIQMKDNRLNKTIQWMKNDLPALAISEIMLGNRFGQYHTPGTVEYEAHSIIEPKLLEEMKKSESQYKKLPYRQKKTDEFYGDDFYKNLGAYQNGGEMKYYQEGLDFKPKTISKDGSQLVKLDQLTNFTNYNTKQPGGWLSKYE